MLCRESHGLRRAISICEWAVGLPDRSVFALYSEPLDVLGETIVTVINKLSKYSSKRVIIYNKGHAHSTEDLLNTLPVDEVVTLPNIGREGETYLVSFVVLIQSLSLESHHPTLQHALSACTAYSFPPTASSLGSMVIHPSPTAALVPYRLPQFRPLPYPDLRA